MKDNLFEMLLSLFETSLSQLQESHRPAETEAGSDVTDAASDEEYAAVADDQVLYCKFQAPTSTRLFTYEEQMRLTKASYQFLIRMKQWNVVNEQSFELIMDQIQFSDSRIVTLQETKWIIRNVLASNLGAAQIAFLDLIIYQSEDELTLH